MKSSGFRPWAEQYGARTISRQHRQLDVLHERVMEALATKRIHTALENFDRFADALESHLALEEFFQFRTIEALCPWLSEELEVVRGEHAGLRSQSEKVRMLLLVGDAETSATDLGRFADAIAEHEEREESLMLRAAQRRERN